MEAAHQKNWNEAFQIHSQSMWNSMFRLALSLSHNRSRAEECTQEALLRALKYFPKFAQSRLDCPTPQQLERSLDEGSNRAYLKNWLLKITKNVFLNDALEMDQWNKKINEDADLDTLPASQENPQNPGKSDANELGEKEFFDLACDDGLLEALSKLNPQQRSLLYFSSEGFSYKEMSDLLEVPIGTVR